MSTDYPGESIEEQLRELRARVEALEKTEPKKLPPGSFPAFWRKSDKELAEAALTESEVRMRHPRFVLESKLLTVTRGTMWATAVMAFVTALLAVATFLSLGHQHCP